jgi:hypothetical protein
VGAVSAVLYHNGREWERIFGETVTENDTALRPFIPTLDVLTDFVETQNNAQCNTLIFLSGRLSSNFAVSRVLGASPHEEQAVLIECLIRIGELLDAHPNVNIRLLWPPRTIPSFGFKRAGNWHLRPLIECGSSTPLRLAVRKDQKKKTKETAITTWAER